MKLKILALTFTSVLTLSASAEIISCTASGKNYGVVKIDAVTTNQAVYSTVSVQNADGSIKTIPTFTTTLAADGSFQIAPDFYYGPFGIVDSFLVKKDNGYMLDTKTFCNFYYQEETCGPGQVINESIENDLNCTNLNFPFPKPVIL